MLEWFPVDSPPDEGSIPGYLLIVKRLIEVKVEFDTGDLELVCEENLGCSTTLFYGGCLKMSKCKASEIRRNEAYAHGIRCKVQGVWPKFITMGEQIAP